MRNGGKSERRRRGQGRQVLPTLQEEHRRQRHIRPQDLLSHLDLQFRGRKAVRCAPRLPVPSSRPSLSQHHWICLNPRCRISMECPAARGVQRLQEYARLFLQRFALGFRRSASMALHIHHRYVRHYHLPIHHHRHLFAHGIDAAATIRVAGTRAHRRVHARHRLS